MKRYPANRYASDKERAQTTAKWQIEWVLTNQTQLCMSGLKGKSIVATAKEYMGRINNKEQLNEYELTTADNLYEKTMRILGFGAVAVHHDMKKSLRY